MRSHTTARFRALLSQLPGPVQRQARDAYRLFEQDPFHPSLRFRQVHAVLPIYSARVGIGHRALGRREDDDVIWFWIGSHAVYDQVRSRL